MQGIFPLLVLILTCGMLASAVAAQPQPHRARLSVVIDFIDVVASSPAPLVKEDVDRIMAGIAELGFDRVYLRVDATGVLLYPTKVGTPFRDLSGEPYKYMLPTLANLGDAMSVHSEAARRHGLEFFAWIDIRDQDAHEVRWNYYDLEERPNFMRSGGEPSWSDFFRANEHLQLERRQGFQRVTTDNVPRVKWLELRTPDKDQTVTVNDVRLLNSWDNRVYEPVPDTWQVIPAGRDGDHYVHRIGPLDVQAPWIKVAQREYGKWKFLCGTQGKPGFTLYDPQDQPIPPGEWWIRYNDRRPETGQAIGPFSGVNRPGWAFSFDDRGHSAALWMLPFPPARYLSGAPCFAYPQARDHCAGIIAELSEYAVGGVAISARTHVRSASGELYGFNPPIVDEYRRRYGTDIRTEEFDRAKLLALRGEYYTQLMEQFSQILHKKGQKLIAMYEPPADSDAYQGVGDNLVMQDQGPTDYQWQQWDEARTIDSLMVATIGFHMGWTPRLAEHVAAVRRQLKHAELSIFYNPSFDTSNEQFRSFLDASLADPNVSEVAIYEYVEVAPGTELGKVLMEMKQRK